MPPSPARMWRWRRRIGPGEEELWIARLEGCAPCAFTQRPPRPGVRLEAYAKSRAKALRWQRAWGGTVAAIDPRLWTRPRATPPTRIGDRLEIIHEKAKRKGRAAVRRLHIPHGIAFGSGDHATTFMLLRALTRHEFPATARVLDLGTGSGVLALAARLLGAQRIAATDFDPNAVRTARQNEALNFSAPLVRWRRADVKRLRGPARYDLVLANLFSGILCEAAAQIAGVVAPGGQLWLSGVLGSQADEVAAAYRAQKLRHTRMIHRGKWVMIQFSRPE